MGVMERLARTTSQFLVRHRYGFWAYWFLNVSLIVAEVRWHILTRLTIWDVVTVIRLVGAMAHQHVPPT
jgi:hypothetical protein